MYGSNDFNNFLENYPSFKIFKFTLCFLVRTIKLRFEYFLKINFYLTFMRMGQNTKGWFFIHTCTYKKSIFFKKNFYLTFMKMGQNTKSWMFIHTCTYKKTLINTYLET